MSRKWYTTCRIYLSAVRKSALKVGELLFVAQSNLVTHNSRGRLCRFQLFCSRFWTRLSVSAFLWRRMGVSKTPSRSNAQLSSKCLVGDGDDFYFILLKESVDTLKDLYSSQSLKVVREWSDPKTKQVRFRTGFVFGSWGEYSHCCNTRPQSESCKKH